ncbi:hypothetical protein ACLBUU_29115, partial [Pseudomonas aeruginosa]
MHAPSQIRLTFNQDHPEPHEHEDEGAGHGACSPPGRASQYEF